MSEVQGSNSLQGKGWCFLYLVGAFVLFFIMWMYIIYGNNNSLTPNK